MKADSLRAEEVELRRKPAGVERAIGPRYIAAGRADDAGERKHAATADAAEEGAGRGHGARPIEAAGQWQSERGMKIGVVAPSCPLKREAAEGVEALARKQGVTLVVHPQCFLENGHFAGSDPERLAALREMMADPSVDAIWFARGGYGSNRIAAEAARDLPEAARQKRYVGYSDGGFLLAALHNAGLSVAHGPMVQDVARTDGEKAVQRTLDWLMDENPSALEPKLDGPAFAFNLVVLSSMMGTDLEPDFSEAELLIEEVDEELYRIDRFLFHVTSQPGFRKLRQLRLGRCLLKLNDRPFGQELEAIARHWCERAGVPYGGRADIGHDSLNRVVPFPTCNDGASLS
jgi:muramoyltetrapeptide carboxypeptidase